MTRPPVLEQKQAGTRKLHGSDVGQLQALIAKLLVMPRDAFGEMGVKAQRRALSQLSANRQAQILHRCLLGAI